MPGMTDETVLDRGEQPSAAGNLREYSVSELSNHLKRSVEDGFSWVRVRGEISRVSRHSSGHCYFDLKDDRAVLASIIWKGAFPRIRVKPEQGLEVVCSGRITTFPSQSKYQIIVEEMELAGVGALMAMLEARKKKLAGEGLFDPERKKKVPFLPNVIGVVSSPTGAVIRDIMHRLGDRCPRRVLLWPVSVQGDRAASDVAAAIRGFNQFPRNGIPRPDVLIVARGGGSFEDLLPFSDEEVVRAAAKSSIPLISAVGHETDTTLIDYAADIRAPTPSAAAEMAVPVLRDCAEHVAGLQQRQLRAISRAMDQRKRQLMGLVRSLPRLELALCLAATALRHLRRPPSPGTLCQSAAAESTFCASLGNASPAHHCCRNRARSGMRRGFRCQDAPRVRAPFASCQRNSGELFAGSRKSQLPRDPVARLCSRTWRERGIETARLFG